MNATIVPFQLGKRRRQLVPWKAGGAQGSGAMHDAEFGTNEPSRAALEAGAKTAAERVAGLPERLHVRSRRGRYSYR